MKRGNSQRNQRPVLRLNKPKVVTPAIEQEPPSVVSAKALSAVLARHSEVWRSYQPLRIGVIEEVYQVLQKEGLIFSKRVIHKCLRWHCRNRRYIQALQSGGIRYSLDGLVAGEVQADVADDNN